MKDLQQKTQSRINELNGKTDSQSKSELQALQRGQQYIENLLKKLSNGHASKGAGQQAGAGSYGTASRSTGASGSAGANIGGGSGSFSAGV